MEKSFKEAVKHRRTYYAISNQSTIGDSKIQEIIEFAITNVPSAFNSQSSRIVLLLGEHHTKLWDIAKEELHKIIPPVAYPATDAKIDSFAAGYATILYFEDMNTVESLQKQFATYAENFPTWSQQASAMHQFTIWTMLEDNGLGASLQHYNPLIDAQVHTQWDIPQSWKLIAQMPFGTPSQEPGEKTFAPLSERVRIFR
ncbi:MAG: nitroreductase family protein [Muribaculaceae bacterium]